MGDVPYKDKYADSLKKINDELKPSQEKMFKLLNELNKILKLFNNA